VSGCLVFWCFRELRAGWGLSFGKKNEKNWWGMVGWGGGYSRERMVGSCGFLKGAADAVGG